MGAHKHWAFDDSTRLDSLRTHYNFWNDLQYKLLLVDAMFDKETAIPNVCLLFKNIQDRHLQLGEFHVIQIPAIRCSLQCDSLYTGR